MRTSINLSRALLVCTLLLMTFDISYCKKFQRLAEVVTELRQAATMSFFDNAIDFDNPPKYGFTNQGIVAVSKDRSTLTSYRPDGSIAWSRRPPERVISSVRISDNGAFICAYYPLRMEGTGVIEVLKSDGTVMWRKRFDAGFFLSSTGKYLYSEADVMDQSPLTVVETGTGNVLWQKKSDGFQPELLNEETIIHVTQGELTLIEMNSGQVLFKQHLSEYF